MGLSPAMTDLIFDSVKWLHSEMGLTILMVEQRVAEAIEHCDHGYVLETGRVVLSGTIDQLSANDKVRRAYLGM
jgi:branched-chain amino acid transport system ATP-binding protein